MVLNLMPHHPRTRGHLPPLLLVVLFFSCVFVLVPPLSAKGPDEKRLQKKAHELSYEGQLETARDLLEGIETASPAAAARKDEGWDGTSLFLGMIWGSLGMGYFIYGKRTGKALFLLSGIGLCVAPYFISSNLANLVLGLILSVIPFRFDL